MISSIYIALFSSFLLLLSCLSFIFVIDISAVSIWFGLEIILLSSLWWLLTGFRGNTPTEGGEIQYFIIQGACSIILTVFIFLGGGSIIENLESGVGLESSGASFISLICIIIVIWVNMGIAPSHNWVLNIISRGNIILFLLLSTLINIPSLFILTTLLFTNQILGLITGALFIPILFFVGGTLLGNNNFSLWVFFSGISHTFVMLLLISREELFFSWYYFFSYSLFLVVTLGVYLINEGSWSEESLTLLFLLFLGGVPPSFFFFLKGLIITQIAPSSLFSVGVFGFFFFLYSLSIFFLSFSNSLEGPSSINLSPPNEAWNWLGGGNLSLFLLSSGLLLIALF